MKTKPQGKIFTKILAAISIALSCSIISYASTSKTLHIQNDFVSYVQESRSIHENMELEFIEYTSHTELPTYFIHGGDLNSRGSNSVDLTLGSTELSLFHSVSLNQGSSIRFSVSSDSSSDTFIAGIIDENGSQLYVISKNGMISNTFSIDKAGEYQVYFQGKNTNGQDIHLTGMVHMDH